jgi:hypothetical protein
MIEIPSRTKLVLSLNRGLWGEVHPELRQASIEADVSSRVIRIRFEYDGEPPPEAQESCSCAAGECIGDFDALWHLDEQHVARPLSESLQALEHLVYRRFEPEHAV